MMVQTPQTIAETPMSGVASKRRAAAVAIFVAFACLAVRWPLLSQPGFVQDQVFFLHWASLAERGGMPAVYDLRASGQPWCNYPPVYPLILRGLAGVYRLGVGHSLDPGLIADIVAGHSTPEVAAASALFKMPAVIADALTCALLVVWLSRRTSLRLAAGVSLLYGLMPAIVFDSAVWGQVDSISTLFALIALESVLRRHWTWVGVFVALALLTKPQAVILAPVVLGAALFGRTRLGSGAVLRLAVGAVMVTIVTMAPVWSARQHVLKAYTDAANLYPFVHLNGFSAWFLANPLEAPRLEAMTDFYKRDDVASVAGWTPRQLGLLAFGIVAAAILGGLAQTRASEAMIRHAVRILPVAFMALSTQMHERYLVPALAFWAWAHQPTLRWWACWVCIGAVAAINLLWVWEQPLPFEWAAGLAAWLRMPHGGAATGVYSSIALVVVLVVSLTDFEWKKPERPVISGPAGR